MLRTESASAAAVFFRWFFKLRLIDENLLFQLLNKMFCCALRGFYIKDRNQGQV